MGTLVDKIKYLLETKKLIKEAILDMGVLVYKTDTFRDYVDKIKSIRIAEDKIQIRYSTNNYSPAALVSGKVFNLSNIYFEWSYYDGSDNVVPEKGYIIHPDGTIEEFAKESTLNLANRGDYKIIVGNCSKSFRLWWTIQEDYVEIVENRIKLKRLDEITRVLFRDFDTNERFEFKDLLGIELPTSGEYEFCIERPGDYDVFVYTTSGRYNLSLLVE